MDTTTVVYAGFWKRVLAVILDGLIVGAAMSVLGFGGWPMHGPAVYGPKFYASFGASAGVVKIALGWLYYSLLESSKYQATLGKMALGIKVTDLSGARVDFARATGRYFGKILSGIILGIGFLMVAFTAKKQGLHDILAKTLVVNK
ncbi:RDD family protein [Candidatus Parcubacteria bacterium]|nr:RDD family protein [Candidatus Parcubacteria bacterium]